jgi:CRISPR-associated protein Csx14
MSKKLLIATLGTTPADVTEAVDLLAEQNCRPDGVILLRTEDPDVREAYELLASHLPQRDNLTWVDSVSIGQYGDVDTPEAAVEFMQEACRILKSYRDAGCRLFVSIAGGRKAMSALLALAVQFYGAERLFHIWAPPWLEAEGEIVQLRNLPEDVRIQKLHPPLNTMNAEDRPHLVDLPFIGLFPWLEDIRDALKGNPPDRSLKTLLQANNLLDSQARPTELGIAILNILENVEGLPPARQDPCKIAIANHHYRDRLERFARDLCDRFSFITQIQSGEWRSGGAKVKAEPPNRLLVFEHLGTDFSVQLILETTATTSGQLEAAKRAVERYLEQRR